MKVEKTIDAHEKSIHKVFDALTKHIEKYPDDLATLFVGRKMEKDGKATLQASSFINGENYAHFITSHVWQIAKLIEAISPNQVRELFNDALEINKKTNEL
jgi:hypothetical protein